MESRMVSVITPTYNRGKWILECVESVRRQSYPHVEHIVVDDGSTDRDADLVEKKFPDLIRNNRLKILRQANQGPEAARNTGLAVSAGEFITYLDSDDLYMDNHITKLVEPLLSNAEIGVTYGGHVKEWYEISGKFIRREVVPLSQIHPIELRIKNRIPITFMHRKSLIEEIGGFDTTRVGLEDWDFLQRLSEVCRLRWVPSVTCVLRHLGSRASVTENLAGEERELKCQHIIKKAIRRELAGRVRSKELREGLEEFNQFLFGRVVEAARTRPQAPGGYAARTADIRFEKFLEGELDSLIELIREHFMMYHQGIRLRINIPRADSTAIEWISKINWLLEREGLQPVLVKTPENQAIPF